MIGILAVGRAHSEKFVDLPAGRVASAIRSDSHGTIFIVDYKKHDVFAIKKGTVEPEILFRFDLMSRPNDITIARDGTIYASDPNWKGRSRRIGNTTDGRNRDHSSLVRR